MEKIIYFSNTQPKNIFVRGKYDGVAEGAHKATIQHQVVMSEEVNYPEGMFGQPVYVTIADAQIPPIVGVDFDDANSVKVPSNWVKIADVRNQTIRNISLDDGTPTKISLTTSATLCGIGGCGFGFGGYNKLPKHAQSLEDIFGVAYMRGEVVFTWSGLEPNTNYHLFVFGLGLFGEMTQTINIIGGGESITFSQNGGQNKLFVNDRESSEDLLMNLAKQMRSSASGTITIRVTPNSEKGEMSFAGLGICR